MIKRITIKNEQDKWFEPCWQLYVEAFPKEERRPRWYHIEALSAELFRFEALLHQDRLVGFMGWWQVGGFRYIEHLAILPQWRGSGYGKVVLDEFIAESDSPILLEVEHPETDIQQRRIAFYERVGFVLNAHQYAHPSYHTESAEWVSLLVMTAPAAITPEQLEAFKQAAFPAVHFVWDDLSCLKQPPLAP